MAAASKFLTLNVIDPLYHKFQLFMQNPTLIRYGPYEKVSSKRLLNHFNRTQGENVSFNRVFPRLMSEYITMFPQYNLIKKTMTDGVFYLGVGLATDPAATAKPPPLTTKQKNDRRREKNTAILNELKIHILGRTGWSEMEYQCLINLRLFVIIRINKIFNIDATIGATQGELIKYIAQAINDLNTITRSAEIVKTDYERAYASDLNLTAPDMAQRFTDRLLAAERTYSAGLDLEKALDYYLNRGDKLPRLPYIVYPNIQYLRDIIIWLKSHSKYRTELEMRHKHLEYETMENADEDIDEIVDTDTRLTRIIME